jgi:hypothetical protein
VTGAITNTAGTANGVTYLNGSKVLTSGSALVFDGTTLNFGGTTQRFTADTTGATVNDRFAFVTNQANSTTRFYVAPSGTGTSASINVFNNSNLNNASNGSFFVSSTAVTLTAGTTGTGTVFPLTFVVASSERMRISEATGGVGAVGIGYTSLTSVGDSGLAVLGNVGIGTSSPSQKLQVTGAIYANNSTNVAFLMQGSQYNGSIANTSGTNTYSLGYSTNASTHTSVLYWNALGSVSVGIAPSAFTNGWSAIQIGSSALSYSGTGSFTSTQVSDNAYFIGSGSDTVTANYIYGSTPATNYKQYNGQHRWYYAGSGTAGNPITFTQAMTLSAAGELAFGTTNTG